MAKAPIALFSKIQARPKIRTQGLAIGFLARDRLAPTRFGAILGRCLPRSVTILSTMSAPRHFQTSLGTHRVACRCTVSLSPVCSLFRGGCHNQLASLLSSSLFSLPPRRATRLPGVLLVRATTRSLLKGRSFGRFSSVQGGGKARGRVGAVAFIARRSALCVHVATGSFLCRVTPFVLKALLSVNVKGEPIRYVGTVLRKGRGPSTSYSAGNLVLCSVICWFLDGAGGALGFRVARIILRYLGYGAWGVFHATLWVYFNGFFSFIRYFCSVVRVLLASQRLGIVSYFGALCATKVAVFSKQ